MSLTINLKPETVFSLALSQESAGTLVLATPRSGRQVNLTPVVIGARGPGGDGEGIQGPKGDTGDAGPPGADGAQGPKGDTGDAGPPGAVGAQGPKGDTGDAGPPGAVGAQGPKGDTGDAGPPGASGEDFSPGPLGLWDYWYSLRLSTSDSSASEMFLGLGVSGGTNNTTYPVARGYGYNHNGLFLRSGINPNSGYAYYTVNNNNGYFGAISRKFRFQFMWLTDFTGRNVWGGFHNSNGQYDAADGAYFHIEGSNCQAKTADFGSVSAHPTTYALSLNVPYTFDVDVSGDGLSKRFRVYAGTDPIPVMDVTTTNARLTDGVRRVGANVTATEASNTANDIGVLYSLGVGTVDGFNRARG
jgi:Collagen triple helix repeat (20 copies)